MKSMKLEEDLIPDLQDLIELCDSEPTKPFSTTSGYKLDLITQSQERKHMYP